MAKFNETPTIKTENRSGFPAYIMTIKEQLVTAVLTTMLGEPKFYGSTDSNIARLATLLADKDPEFLCKLTCYARNEYNLRSVSQYLACIIAREAPNYTRVTLKNIIQRPDDITEILSCYLSLYGKPFPNAMKREIGVQIQKFDEYQLAKYNSGGKAMKLRDVLRIVHPKPINAEKEALLGKILSDTLETPYTWETELSSRGNTAEVWNELLSSGKVGYMALLRNLANITASGADYQNALAVISDPERVRASRQLPFRYYSAYRTLLDKSLITPEIHAALESALQTSLENTPTIPGRTLIAVDVSGSMGMLISHHSDITCCDIASLMGAMAMHICEDATVCYFDAASRFSRTSEHGYRIAKYGKFDSVLSIALNNAFDGGGTDLSLPMHFALDVDAKTALKPFNRVIYFSDCECNSSYCGLRKTAMGLVEQYRKLHNPNFWVHGVDLQGYGTQQFCGTRFNLIAGWSEKVLPFIMQAEEGMDTLVQAIAEYDIATA